MFNSSAAGAQQASMQLFSPPVGVILLVKAGHCPICNVQSRVFICTSSNADVPRPPAMADVSVIMDCKN
jgi:hypothetical protein